jgi:hypothetical protein
LAGSGLHTPFVGIESGLEVNGVSFRLHNRRQLLILTIDALFVGRGLLEALRAHFVAAWGQRPDDLLVVASHTHYAPSLDEGKPLLGRSDPNYVTLVIERCKALIDRLVAGRAEEICAERRSGESHAAVNRRLPWPLPHLAGRRGIRVEAVMAPNPAGATDSAITTWRIVNLEGQIVALIWHYACHPTGFARPTHVSAEYPGLVRDRLRRRYGPGLPVLFLQGFAGDLRSRVPETRPMWRRAPRTLVFGPSFAAFTTESWRQWAETLADDVMAAFGADRVAVPQSIPTEPEAFGSSSHDIPLSDLVMGDNPHGMVRFQRLKIGNLLDVVAVAAEPLTGLAALVSLPGATLVGYIGETFGYWPTDDDQRYDGYEVSGYFHRFGLKGKFRPRLDPVFRGAIENLRFVR